MTSSEHLEWMAESIAWFESIELVDYTKPVPSCPGWSVEGVINHLSRGLGAAYPLALSCPPDAAPGEAFAEVDFSQPEPHGAEAQRSFSTNMNRCLDLYRVTDPDHACWTYAGPGTARFWFRRAAIELALHRIDAEDALDHQSVALDPRRSSDAVAEAASFALPLAASVTSTALPTIALHHDATGETFVVGDGLPSADVYGGGDDLLAAAWGRGTGPDGIGTLQIEGDKEAAAQWFGLVPIAFASTV